MLGKRKLFSKAGLAVCLALGTIAPALYAAEGPEEEQRISRNSPTKAQNYEVYELGEMQVRGQRESAAKEVILTRTLSSEEIEASGAHELPEALRLLPGLNVTTTGRKHFGSAPFVGFTHEQTQILIDGVPYYEPYRNETNLNAYPTDIVGRIDVMRGAPSVLYGAGGMGGVINLITKQATDEPTFNAYTELGDDETWNIGATHGNRVGEIRYWINARYQTTNGWRLSDSFTPVTAKNASASDPARNRIIQREGKRENSDSESASLWAKIGYEPNENSAYYVTGFYTHNNWSDPWSIYGAENFFSRGSTGAFTAYDKISKYDDWGLDIDAKQRLSSSLVGRLKLFYHGHEDDYESYALNPDTLSLVTRMRDQDGVWQDFYDLSTYKDWVLGGAALVDWEIHETDTLRFAFHYKKDHHEQRSAEWEQFSAASAFTGSAALENEWRPLDGLSIVAGVAYNWYDVDSVDDALREVHRRHYRSKDYPGGKFPIPDVKDSVDPMIGASYTFADATRLFGSVALRSRFPSLRELYGSRQGNPELDQERSTNYTLGLERPFLDDTLTISLAGFYNNIEDRIDNDVNGVAYNSGKTRIYGLESAAIWKPVDSFTLRLGYTLAEGENRSAGPEFLTDDAENVPQHKLTAALSYAIPEILTRFDLNGVFVSDQYSSIPTRDDPEGRRIAGYSLINLRVSQPILEHFELYAQAYNLLDANYEERYGYPCRGRSFLVGMKTMF